MGKFLTVARAILIHMTCKSGIRIPPASWPELNFDTRDLPVCYIYNFFLSDLGKKYTASFAHIYFYHESRCHVLENIFYNFPVFQHKKNEKIVI